MKKETKKIINILLQAGAIAIKEQKKLTVNTKSDLSIVTNGDIAVSSFLEKEIQNLGYEVFSEENSKKIPKTQKVVIIDPIDGTESYSRKQNSWSILLGFTEGQKITQGFVYQPTTKRLFFSELGKGAFVYDLQTNCVSKLTPRSSGVFFAASSPKNYGEIEFLESLGIKNTKKSFSASLKIMEVCLGHVDIYPNFRKKCSSWDLVGPLAILREAKCDMIFEKPFTINFANPEVPFKFVAVGPRFCDLKINF